jgi:hypothetical protein
MADAADRNKPSRAELRQARLAAELRANLKKRREQARKRAEGDAGPPAPRGRGEEPNESQV